jgi:hypothetical protein
VRHGKVGYSTSPLEPVLLAGIVSVDVFQYSELAALFLGARWIPVWAGRLLENGVDRRQRRGP